MKESDFNVSVAIPAKEWFQQIRDAKLQYGTLESAQRDTAIDRGYSDARVMNMEHDPLHGALCHFLNIPSYALADARGEDLTEVQHTLAALEEAAVMACQKLRQMHRALDV